MKKSSFKGFSSIILALLMILTSLFGTFTNEVYAQRSIMMDLSVNKTEIRQGQNFTVIVKFGGPGTKVSEGQTEEITFDLADTKIELPKSPIELRDKSGHLLGNVEFHGD